MAISGANKEVINGGSRVETSGDNQETNKAISRADGAIKVRISMDSKGETNGVANNKAEINGANQETNRVDGAIRALINGEASSKGTNGADNNKVEINGEANNRVATSGVNRVVSSKAATKEAGACRAY